LAVYGVAAAPCIIEKPVSEEVPEMELIINTNQTVVATAHSDTPTDEPVNWADM
jgi:hypothetical protein